VATRTAARGLSTSELEHIRDALAGGRRPKVVFTQAAGQIAGQQGQVVELTDPAVSEEWVVVRFGRDELPFSPTDLAVAPRPTPARRTAKASARSTPQPPPTPSAAATTATSTVPTPREESTVTRPATAATAKAPVNGKTVATPSPDPEPATDTRSTDIKHPAGPRQPPGSKQSADTRQPAADTGQPAAGTAASGDQPARTPAKAPVRKAGRNKPPATLTVTLSYTDGEWMVAAQQGSKSLAKPYVIKATEALKMVGMLDVPGVHEAVEEIVAAARAEAESAAERLRAELAEIEARLAELREAT
jgi:hypothetical protein